MARRTPVGVRPDLLTPPRSVFARYWHAPAEEPALDFGGFLLDPETPFLRQPAALARLASLDAVPCVVLLGPPGAGKSTELAREAERLDRPARSDQPVASPRCSDAPTSAAPPADGTRGVEPPPGLGAPGDVVVRRDLRDYDDLGDLCHDVFAGPEVRAWRAGTGRLTLLLDSLDEGLLEMRPLAARLGTELGRLPVDRLRLRIACRAFEFPDVLRRALASLWPGAAFRTMTLAPLRQADVLALAAERLGSADRAGDFLEQVRRREAAALAMWPNTLQFLLRSFEATGGFPARRADLYLAGCRSLVTEDNEGRRAAGHIGDLDPDARLAVAARVAAATLFANRAAVTTTPVVGGNAAAHGTDVPTLAVLGTEPVGDTVAGVRLRAPLDVNEAGVRETLGTALFSSRGRERVGWAHLSYGEFLAAWWVTRHEMPLDQIRGLLEHPGDPEWSGLGRAVVPQLYEVAAWLASLSPTVFDHLLATEPWILLRSDAASVPPEVRVRLIDALLAAAARGELPWREFGHWLAYERLGHPGLAAQLARVVTDPSVPDQSRHLALDIGRHAGTSGAAFVDAAATLALDDAASVDLRTAAARAVADAGDATVGARLRPLALTTRPEDVADALKAAALRAAADALTPDELFGALTPPRRPNAGGGYGEVMSAMADRVTAAQLVPGLRWAAAEHGEIVGGGRALRASLLRAALRHLDDPAVRAGFAQCAMRRLVAYRPLVDPETDGREALTEDLADAPTRRHAVAALVVEAPRIVGRTAVVPATDGVGQQPWHEVVARALTLHLSDGDRDLARPGDLCWVLDVLGPGDAAAVGVAWLTPEDRETTRPAWRQLAHELFDSFDATQVLAVSERRDEPEVAAVFGARFRTVDLDAPDIVAFREDRRRQEEKRAATRARLEALTREQAAARRPAEDAPPPSLERVAAALEATAELPSAGAGGGESPAEAAAAHRARVRWMTAAWELFRLSAAGGTEAERAAQHAEHDGDVRATSAWSAADLLLRRGIVAAAATYLRDAEPERPPRSSVRVHNPSWYGYLAMRLLAAEDPATLRDLPQALWERWVADVIDVDLPRGSGALEVTHEPEPVEREQVTLLRLARDRAGARYDALVLDRIDDLLAPPTAEWYPYSNAVAPLLRAVRAAASTPLGDAVLARCLGPDAAAPPLVSTAVLQALLAGEHPRTRERCEAALAALPEFVPADGAASQAPALASSDPLAEGMPEPTPDARETRALAAAGALLLSTPDGGWGVVAPVLEARPAFARTLFLLLARHREQPIPALTARFHPSAVADLFVWMVRAFPYAEDPWHVGAYSPGPRDNVVTWRRALLDTLAEWRSPAALDALAGLIRRLPAEPWLAGYLVKARAGHRQLTWVAPDPGEVLALAADHGRRLVRSGDQLLELVVASLRSYERYLQGSPPAVRGLWNYLGDSRWRPKEEGDLADDAARFLERELRARGVTASREVVVRRGGYGTSPGLRTDIQVSTAVPVIESAAGAQALAPAVVIIEVKGSWHREVHTAMETQLVHDYLRDTAAVRHGVFLVGFYTCAAWEPDAAFRQSASLGDQATLTATLERQAAALSDGRRRVRAVVVNAALP